VLNARVIGGIQMIDNNEADDKIVAILDNDQVWEGVRELTELPAALLERLTHYFSTYKLVPGSPNKVRLASSYSREHAGRVIVASQEDYTEVYGETPPTLRF